LPDDLAAELGANEVAGSVAVQADQSEAETRFLLDISERHRFVLGVVGWVDLLAGDLEEQLQRYAVHQHLCGVRHIAQAEPNSFLQREDVVRGIGTLHRFDLTYDILVYPPQLPAALSLVQRLPDQRFVVDHAAKPRIRDGIVEPWAKHMKQLAGHENVWCKVSGLVTEGDWNGWTPGMFEPYLDVVFEAFGTERLMFGSDWPVCTLAASYAQVADLIDDYTRDLSTTEREAVFGGNAIEFYGLTI
jgi:L-fuconolactonase